MKKALSLILALAMFAVSLAGCGSDGGSRKVGEVYQAEPVSVNPVKEETSQDNTKSSLDTTEAPQEKTEYYVGDVVQNGDLKLVYMSSGVYTEENQFMQPDEGKQYIYLQFAAENTSDKNDVSISFYSFECYADGYAADMYYGGDNGLSATLSAGRFTTGYIYYSVPVDENEIEVEYTVNIVTDKKIKFIYEGEKDSGYVPEGNSAVTEDAYSVGDIVESSQLRITYLSCEEYISDNQFIQPKEGYQYISCEFEFENLGNSDEHVSYFSFDCYADGTDCEGVYSRDDALSATISAGRKAKGTVTFEVPVDADIVEVEYLSNYWTSNRVVFKVR